MYKLTTKDQSPDIQEKTKVSIKIHKKLVIGGKFLALIKASIRDLSKHLLEAFSMSETR